MTIEELVAHIFVGQENDLATQAESWIRSSRRFRAFAEMYKDKIRKKVRTVENAERMKDVRFELETAFRLLKDERFEVEYEKQGLGKQRAPDFTVTFRANTVVTIEVRRISYSGAADDEVTVSKLMGLICDKAGQTLPHMVNVLVLGSERVIDEALLGQAMTSLRLRAERKDDAYFARHGYEDAITFLKQFRQLSALIVSGAGIVWLNSLASNAVPKALRAALGTI